MVINRARIQVMGPDPPSTHFVCVCVDGRGRCFFSYPIGSMYGIYTYIWLILMVNVGKYTSPMDPSWVWKEEEEE